MKKILFAAAMSVVLMGTEASAALILLDQWVAPITVGDKTFTPISHSASFSPNAFINIELSGDPHTGSYSFSLGSLGSVTGGLNATIEYAITINDPGWYFKTAALDVTHIRPESIVTKDVYADSGFTTLLGSLQSPNGIPAMDFNFVNPLRTTLYIRDTTVLDATGSIAGFTNVFTQQQAAQVATPEPASLSLAGVGAFAVMGMVFRRRRMMAHA